MSKFYPLSVANVRNETRDTIAVTFDVPAELQQQFRFQQGQPHFAQASLHVFFGKLAASAK